MRVCVCNYAVNVTYMYVRLLASGSCVTYVVMIKLGNMKHCIEIVVSKQSIESLYNASF